MRLQFPRTLFIPFFPAKKLLPAHRVTPLPASALDLLRAPTGPSGQSVELIACGLSASAGNSALCDYFLRCPRTMQSTRDPPAGAARDKASHARPAALRPSDVQSHARWCDRAPGPVLMSA